MVLLRCFDSLDKLTKREKEICSLLIEGFDNQDIGRRLFISKHTVKTHLRNIYSKTGFNNRAKLIVRLLSAK